jgi:hypothetical protein
MAIIVEQALTPAWATYVDASELVQISSSLT